MGEHFVRGFAKTAGLRDMFHDASALDRHGLKMLAIAPAYHGYKAIKEKDKGEAALAGTELAGLAALHRAVSIGHK